MGSDHPDNQYRKRIRKRDRTIIHFRPADFHPKTKCRAKNFRKNTGIKAGESETVKLEFTDYDLASFDEANSQWLTSKGEYTLSFGASSKDFRATLPLNISKNRTWKVNNVLRPVEKINVMKFPLK